MGGAPEKKISRIGVVMLVAWHSTGDVSGVSDRRCGPWQTVAPEASFRPVVAAVALSLVQTRVPQGKAAPAWAPLRAREHELAHSPLLQIKHMRHSCSPMRSRPIMLGFQHAGFS